MPDAPSPVTSRRAFLGGAAAVAATILAGCAGAPKVASSIEREDIAYGSGPSQGGVLTMPKVAGNRPVVILVHGGYWKLGLNHAELESLGDNLAQSGYATWNIDYRRLGEGGGWTATLDDVAAAVDLLPTLVPKRPLDLSRVGIIGHSAGGQLAMWAASRKAIPPGAPWSNPAVPITAAVSLAGAVDLKMAATATGAGDNVVKLRESVISLLNGTPDQVADRYRSASPIERLPLGIPQLLVHGAKDDIIPLEQSRAYVAAAAKTPDRVRLIELPAAEHADVIDTNKAGWSEIVSWLHTNVGDPTVTGG